MLILNVLFLILIVRVQEHLESLGTLILLFFEAGLPVQLLLPNLLKPIRFFGLLRLLSSLFLLLLVFLVVALCV